MEVPLSHICESLGLELAASLEERGWTFKRLGVLLDDMDIALPILLDQLKGSEALLEVGQGDLRRLLGSFNLSADRFKYQPARRGFCAKCSR